MVPYPKSTIISKCSLHSSINFFLVLLFFQRSNQCPNRVIFVMIITTELILAIIILKEKFKMPRKIDRDTRLAQMDFSSIYQLYITKIIRKGRTKDELDQVIEWLTGFEKNELKELIENSVTFEDFFNKATINPNSSYITGSICGYKVQDIENPLTKNIRYLDKLVDELAKGKKMEKILREPK